MKLKRFKNIQPQPKVLHVLLKWVYLVCLISFLQINGGNFRCVYIIIWKILPVKSLISLHSPVVVISRKNDSVTVWDRYNNVHEQWKNHELEPCLKKGGKSPRFAKLVTSQNIQAMWLVKIIWLLIDYFTIKSWFQITL